MEKVAWISGCSQGLGRAMVAGLIEKGWRIGGFSRNERVMDELQGLYGESHLFRAADVLDELVVEKFCEEARSKVGAPDLLINNAAVINDPKKLWETSAAEFSEIIDINIKGVANVIRAALPMMIQRGGGIVVNFSSGWGRSTAPEVAPYCATKWAIEGLTQALAQELPNGLAAVALNPGIINTEMLRSSFGTAAISYETPEEWKPRAVKLLTGLSIRDNGRALTV